LGEVRQTVAARRRKAHLRWLTLAAALIVVAGLGLEFLLPTRHPDRPASTFSAAAGYTVSGRASLSAKPWGTAVTVELADLPAKGPFVLQVTSADGRKEQAATWATTPTAAAAVTGATSLHIPDIRSIAVLDHEGHRLATTRAS
jgi:hypothetical protein